MLTSSLLQFAIEKFIRPILNGAVHISVQLQPNCLITRFPIILVYSKSFSFTQKIRTLWLRAYLYEHGYIVSDFAVNPQNDTDLLEQIQSIPQHKNSKFFHILAPQSDTSLNELQPLSSKNSLTYWHSLPRLKETGQQVLKQAVGLAEEDFVRGN